MFFGHSLSLNTGFQYSSFKSMSQNTDFFNSLTGCPKILISITGCPKILISFKNMSQNTNSYYKLSQNTDFYRRLSQNFDFLCLTMLKQILPQTILNRFDHEWLGGRVSEEEEKVLFVLTQIFFDSLTGSAAYGTKPTRNIFLWKIPDIYQVRDNINKVSGNTLF